jgi:hypothetical protein
MVIYWKNQRAFDATFGAILTLILWYAPVLGIPIFFSIDSDLAIVSARSWVGPTLTLLGMMSATTAFIFSVVDRAEFKLLKSTSSESYLWVIFSENLLWLSITSFATCAISLFLKPISSYIFYVMSYFLIMTLICIYKFAWAIRQIISVRIAKSGNHSV